MGRIINAIRSLTGDTRSSTFGLWSRERIAPHVPKLTNPYLQHPYAHGAIRMAAQMLGGVPFSIVKEDTSQRDAIKKAETREELEFALQRNLAIKAMNPKRVRASDRPVEKVSTSKFNPVFQTINPSMARAEFFQGLVTYLLCEGNAIVLWMGGASPILEENIIPSEAYVYGRSGWEWDEDSKTWSVRTASKTETYPAHQVTHFSVFTPDSSMWGQSPLTAATEKMTQDILADGWNSAFLQNGGDPGGILKSGTDLTREEAERLRGVWESRHGGPRGNGKTAILTAGLEYDRNPTTHKDMEFNELGKANREAILAALLMHKSALGVTDQLNRATITEARRMVWTNLLLPMAAYIEDRLFTSLFSRFNAGGEFGAFDMTGVSELQEDIGEKAATAEILTKIGVPLNDAVQLLGLPLQAYDWGEEAYTAINQVPYSLLKDPFKGMEEAEPLRGSKRDVGAPGREEEDADPVWTEWWRRVGEKSEKKFQSTIRRLIFEIRKDQLRRLEAKRDIRKGPSIADLEDILFDADRWGQEIADAANPIYQKILRDSVKQLNRELKKMGFPEVSLGGELEDPFSINDKAIGEYLLRKEMEIKKVADTIRKEVAKELKEGISQGETMNQLAARVKTAFNGAVQPYRTLRIARTETTSAANGIRYMGLKIAGAKTKRWISAPDARDTHQRARDEGEIDVNQRFGNGLMSPGEPGQPAKEVVNCRCTLVAGITKPEDIAPEVLP